jgi:hypothetical protein
MKKRRWNTMKRKENERRNYKDGGRQRRGTLGQRTQ